MSRLAWAGPLSASGGTRTARCITSGRVTTATLTMTNSVQGAEDYYPYLCWDGQVGPSTSGKVYIQYEVKVLPGFTGTVTNKADFFADWGESYHEFFARTATTEIFYGVFLPLMTK